MTNQLARRANDSKWQMPRPRLPRTGKGLLIAGAAVLTLGLVGGGTAATLAASTSSNTIKACVKSSNHDVTWVPSSTTSCPRGSWLLSWNAQGPKGATGAAGKNGTNGANGKDGATGPVGPSGAPGTDGKDGTNGTNGTDGKDGATGPQGPAGPAGPQGPQGPAGPAGTWTPTQAIAVTTFHDHDDSGAGGTWAKDGPFTRTATVVRHAAVPVSNCGAGAKVCYFYDLSISDNGTFTTLDGAKDPATGTTPISNVVTGTFVGGGSIEVYASVDKPDGSLVETSVTGNAKYSTSNWAKEFVPDGTLVVSSWVDWGWTYTTPCEKWVDNASGLTGNITGVTTCPNGVLKSNVKKAHGIVKK